MAGVEEGALAHARAVAAKGQVVVRLSPAEGLGRGEHGGLRLLVVVAKLPVRAPARLVLALGAVVRPILGLVLHLEHVVEAAGVGLGGQFLLLRGLGDLGLAEIIDVGVLLVQLGLHLLDALHRRGMRLAVFFLSGKGI